MSAPAQELLSQPMRALAGGNAKRLAQADLKRRLKARKVTLFEAFSDDAAGDMYVSRLMEAVPYLNAERVSTVLLMAGVGYARRVRNLRPRDRWTIMHLLAERHPGIKVRP